MVQRISTSAAYDTAINNGQWSTDLVNANGPMVMHASIGAGGSTLRTLTFGGSGTNIATLSLRNGESLTASNKLNMRHNAIVEIAGGALTGGTELIGVSGGPNAAARSMTMMRMAPAMPRGRRRMKSAQKRTNRRRPVDSKKRRLAISSADVARSGATRGSAPVIYEYRIRGSSTT